MRRALTTPELRRAKLTRDEFLLRPRRPITVVLDGVTQNYYIGAIFRLCDAFLVQQLVICGTKVELHKRRLVQAAQGTQHWVAWRECPHADETIAEAKALGAWVVVAEQTTGSVRPDELALTFPAILILGGERGGVSPEVIDKADAAVAIPMLGMANYRSMNALGCSELRSRQLIEQRLSPLLIEASKPSVNQPSTERKDREPPPACVSHKSGGWGTEIEGVPYA